jgi:hypothetical protein
LARLSELQFDKTITCTVTNAEKSNDGEYSVTDDNLREFTAYSDSIKYVQNDRVSVLVPNGDFS